jgi:glutamine cyclotransferase
MTLLVFATGGCSKQAGGANPSIPAVPSWDGTEPAPKAVRYTYEVVATWPHDRGAFTQGLVFHEGSLLESTGLNGESSLREVDLKTGRPLKQIALSREFFAEGLAVVAGKAFQLTWQNQKVFVYDAYTFQRIGEFSYQGEGWGLTTDGQRLIMSDGSNRLRFLDPRTFSVVRTVEVTLDGKPETRLNELEFINGEILANVWMTDLVVRIDPATGAVRGMIDFSALLPAMDRRPDTDVLNGIAYDTTTGRLYVTGKRWPALFEVRLKVQP